MNSFHLSQSLKHTFSLGLLGLSLILSSNSHAQLEILDQVVAVVEDGIILDSQLNKRVSTLSREFNTAGKPLPPENILRKELLEQLIMESIQLQQAQRFGIKVNDDLLSQTMERIASQNNKSIIEFKQLVESEGIVYSDLRGRIRNDLVMSQLQQKAITNRITITAQDVKNYLESGKGKTVHSAAYRLGHILIAIPETATQAEKERKRLEVEELIKKLQNEDFLSTAKTYSANADLGWRKADQLPTLFSKPVPTMEIGDIAEPIMSSSGFHIIKLLDKKGGDHKMVNQTKARHILIKPNEIRSQEDAEQFIIDIRQQIIAGKDFATMAKTYSEDPVSASAGGSLGWSTPGTFVPIFEETLTQSEIGEISDPFLSTFGWHITQVEERREENIGKEVQLNEARGVLQKQRFEEERQLWLREIRQDAFVEIKDEKIKADIEAAKT